MIHTISLICIRTDAGLNGLNGHPEEENVEGQKEVEELNEDRAFEVKGYRGKLVRV